MHCQTSLSLIILMRRARVSQTRVGKGQGSGVMAGVRGSTLGSYRNLQLPSSGHKTEASLLLLPTPTLHTIEHVGSGVMGLLLDRLESYGWTSAIGHCHVVDYDYSESW